jgi:hypothetical protein
MWFVESPDMTLFYCRKVSEKKIKGKRKYRSDLSPKKNDSSADYRTPPPTQRDLASLPASNGTASLGPTPS